MRHIWNTQDGRQIPVEKMSDDHVRNSYQMMKRNGFVSMKTLMFYLIGPQPRGEMAQMAVEHEMDRMFDKPTSKWIDVFEDEAKRRGIAID